MEIYYYKTLSKQNGQKKYERKTYFSISLFLSRIFVQRNQYIFGTILTKLNSKRKKIQKTTTNLSQKLFPKQRSTKLKKKKIEKMKNPMNRM